MVALQVQCRGLGQGKTIHVDVVIRVGGTAFLNDNVQVCVASVLVVVEKTEFLDMGFTGQIQSVRVGGSAPTLW